MANEPRLPQFESWLGDGPNEPITGRQLAEALGEDRLAALAAETGRDKTELADQLADELPDYVDAVSPDGTIDPNLQQTRTLSVFAGSPNGGRQQGLSQFLDYLATQDDVYGPSIDDTVG
jgi:hypothetical protein